jgi:hypothetical protein
MVGDVGNLDECRGALLGGGVVHAGPAGVEDVLAVRVVVHTHDEREGKPVMVCLRQLAERVLIFLTELVQAGCALVGKEVLAGGSVGTVVGETDRPLTR